MSFAVNNRACCGIFERRAASVHQRARNLNRRTFVKRRPLRGPDARILISDGCDFDLSERMARRNVVRIGIFLGAMAVVALAFLARVAPGLREHRMRYWHMRWLEYGAQKYKRSHGVFPTNLTQLVQERILPFESEIYACPLMMRSPVPLFPSARNYLQSDYTLINSNEVLYIQVRSNIAERVRLRYPELRPEDLTLATHIRTDGPYIGNGDGTAATPPGKWH